MDTYCLDDFPTRETALDDPLAYLLAAGMPLTCVAELRDKGYDDGEIADLEWDLRQSGLSLMDDPDGLHAVGPKKAPPTLEETLGLPCLRTAQYVAYEPPRWLLKPYFQKGAGTLIQADPGAGKTAFMCAVAACVSRGADLLGLPVDDPGDVLILSVEDEIGVLRGRLEASGADLRRCHFVENAAGLSMSGSEVEQFILTTHARLVIFDPLQAFLGADLDMYRSNETRPELARLFSMARRHDCAVAIVAHLAKAKTGKTPVTQSLGSVDIPAAMRSVLQLIRCPTDPTCRTAVHVKCSNAERGKSIDFRIGERGGVRFVGLSDIAPEDIDAARERADKGVPYENEPLVELFLHLIAEKPGGGFYSYAKLREEGMKLLGFPPFADVPSLRRYLEAGLDKQLLERDGLLVVSNQTGPHNARGIRLQKYRVPNSYQTKLEEAG